MIVKCEKCGKEYDLNPREDPSSYQCECGGELSSTIISDESPKTEQKPGKKEWKDLSKGEKAIGLGLLCIIGLIIIVALGALFSPNQSTSSAQKTYSGQGMTFNYPASWEISSSGNIKTPNTQNIASGSATNLGSLTEYASSDLPIPATLDAAANDIRSGVEGSANKQFITIGGVQGIIYIPNGNGRQRVDVIFVKGDTLYSVWLNTNDFNADKSGIDMIINSMKLS